MEASGVLEGISTDAWLLTPVCNSLALRYGELVHKMWLPPCSERLTRLW